MERDFEKWLSGFRESIADYKYYIDFNKVFANVDAMKVALNILNSLVGSKTIEADFKALLHRYPETLCCLPVLLAKREKEIRATDGNGAALYRFDKANCSVDEYAYFMRETGLFGLLQNRIVRSLEDYVTGVEVGLDSNARKNRGGHLMEDLVERYIVKAGYKKDSTYFKEMYHSEVEQRWGVDLSTLSNDGNTRKRFDYVIKTPTTIYAIETNFYASAGSKLNETARSYKTLALEARGIAGFAFMWITDGQGWHKAKNNLKETFDVLPTLYNINELDEGVLENLR